ncbi:M23 family metallopeptidase [Neobacillus terrae]|uniref:M23 family metallopeptidase n=1 Tax=Neobacillus terrae TaxID=3034837 RepID=UPI001408AADD|nr:M23 family metallopeptidase [Neobacillus terrae]NHM30066.1 M23 family metallopeptidase [Neobacillus terrae]
MREEEKRSSQGSSYKRFFKKRWVFPAIYIASAAIILTVVLWYQNSSSATDKYGYKANDIAGKNNNHPAVEVSRALENFVMPVSKSVAPVIEKKFYDFKGKEADQEAALVYYDNKYVPNSGIDVKSKDGKSFDVVAALSGTVTKVEEDTLLGNVIELEHDKGIVTQYQSVKDMKVKVGDQVEQGQVLASAGQSLFNEKAGVHVHFEIRKDGVAVNPETYLDKPLSALEADNGTPAASDDGVQGHDSKLDDQSSTPDEKGTTEDQTKDSKDQNTDSKSKDATDTKPKDSSDSKSKDSTDTKSKEKSSDSKSDKKSDDSKTPSEESSKDSSNS